MDDNHGNVIDSDCEHELHHDQEEEALFASPISVIENQHFDLFIRYPVWWFKVTGTLQQKTGLISKISKVKQGLGLQMITAKFLIGLISSIALLLRINFRRMD